MPARSEFKVSVTKDNIVFASAHFITFRGHRCETLHGHNYRTRVSVEGGIDPETSFVIDFAELKQLMKRLVDEIDHRVLLPLQNPKLQIKEAGDSVTVAYEGAPRYMFPKRDCALLPIPNTTVEMLAKYLAERTRLELERAGGSAVELKSIEVEVEENFGQSATYRQSLE
jgi:6-pyruvoyltetrahydropterin/6-carboxytetrahydropterin synthase